MNIGSVQERIGRLGSLRNDDGNSNENGDGNENGNALIPSRLIRTNVGEFFWSWILKDCIKVHEKKKKVVVMCSRPRQNVKLGTFTL